LRAWQGDETSRSAQKASSESGNVGLELSAID
jgi:hypothetical protein